MNRPLEDGKECKEVFFRAVERLIYIYLSEHGLHFYNYIYLSIMLCFKFVIFIITDTDIGYEPNACLEYYCTNMI